METGRHIVWFSCGAASAVVAKLAVTELPNVVVCYCDVSKDEHPDNARFLADVERWIGQPIIRLKSKWESVKDVFRHFRYMSGILGARCTVEMKKKLRLEFQRPGDVHLFGYTNEETERIKDFSADNHDLNLRWLLQERELEKADCLGVLKFAGIEIPAMYKLGFKNNNCIGCVKATSPRYWALIRKLFPEQFAELAALSRELGCRLVRFKGERIFLDELPPGDFKNLRQESISCGPECGVIALATS